MAASRTIIGIRSHEGRLVFCLDKAAVSPPNARSLAVLQGAPDEDDALDSPELAREHGNAISKALLAHEGVRRALENVFDVTAGEAQTLLFRIAAESGEGTRWETLCDPRGRHVALTGRCHVGRIAEETGSDERPWRGFTPPLRIAAFLSGHELDATDEWNGLVKALAAAAGEGQLPLRADVYIGQPALLERARQHTLPPGLLRVHPIPPTPAEMEAALAACGAHIVHFYCHGSAADGEPVLQLASLVDHSARPPRPGSVQLLASELAALPALRDRAWVVLLNCCEGAASARARHSMAYRLVSEGGVGAAIGMQAPVLQGEASAFSAALYPALFEALKPVMQAPANQLLVLDLARVITPPRRVLRDLTEKEHGGARWSLPVLYLQAPPFLVMREVPADTDRNPVTNAKTDTSMELRDRVSIVAGLLKRLPPDTPPEVRVRVLAVLDADPPVPAGLRPDANGQFTVQDE